MPPTLRPPEPTRTLLNHYLSAQADASRWRKAAPMLSRLRSRDADWLRRQIVERGS